MKVIDTSIEEVKIIEPSIFADARGCFFESFSQRDFSRLVCDTLFVQDNESHSTRGVVRALHYQLPPAAQSKLVRVVSGEVLDVAVDIRRGSPTFGRYVAVRLSAENHRQLFIPRGFAHGFAVVSDQATFQYKCDNYYAPQCEASIVWNDPDLGVDWGVESPVLSAKDAAAPRLRCAKLFDYDDKLY